MFEALGRLKDERIQLAGDQSQLQREVSIGWAMISTTSQNGRLSAFWTGQLGVWIHAGTGTITVQAVCVNVKVLQ